jgi:metal-responsive CopG/Arc/MetJ family transcriptional regulator
MDIISLKLDEKMLKNIDSCLKKNNFSTRTELIRDAIREKLSALEKEEAIRKLIAYRGIMKGKSKMSDEEARELVGREYAAKHGIKLD